MPIQYAVNIADATQDNILAQFLIAPVIQSKTIVEAERGRLDGSAVKLDCDEVRAKAVCEVIRLKYHRNKFRCYQSKTGRAWTRI